MLIIGIIYNNGSFRYLYGEYFPDFMEKYYDSKSKDLHQGRRFNVLFYDLEFQTSTESFSVNDSNKSVSYYAIEDHENLLRLRRNENYPIISFAQKVPGYDLLTISRSTNAQSKAWTAVIDDQNESKLYLHHMKIDRNQTYCTGFMNNDVLYTRSCKPITLEFYESSDVTSFKTIEISSGAR